MARTRSYSIMTTADELSLICAIAENDSALEKELGMPSGSIYAVKNSKSQTYNNQYKFEKVTLEIDENDSEQDSLWLMYNF